MPWGYQLSGCYLFHIILNFNTTQIMCFFFNLKNLYFFLLTATIKEISTCVRTDIFKRAFWFLLSCCLYIILRFLSPPCLKMYHNGELPQILALSFVEVRRDRYTEGLGGILTLRRLTTTTVVIPHR